MSSDLFGRKLERRLYLNIAGCSLLVLCAGVATRSHWTGELLIVLSATALGCCVPAIVRSFAQETPLSRIENRIDALSDVGLTSDPTHLDPLRGKFSRYQVTQMKKGGPWVWRHSPIDFAGSPSNKLVATVEHINEAGRKINYEIECGKWGNRLILLGKNLDGATEESTVQLYPCFDPSSFKDDQEYKCGFSLIQTFSGKHGLLPCLVADQPCCEVDEYGTVRDPESIRMLNQIWSSRLSTESEFEVCRLPEVEHQFASGVDNDG